MVLLQSIRVNSSFLLFLALLGGSDGIADAEEPPGSGPPELQLSLRDAIHAAIDNNVNVRLLKERIAVAQAQADANLEALLPNVSGYVNGWNQTVNLTAFGLFADRLSGFGLTRSVTEPFEVYDARTILVQNIFSLSLIQRWRASKTGVDIAGLEADVTKRDVMATVGLLLLDLRTFMIGLAEFHNLRDVASRLLCQAFAILLNCRKKFAADRRASLML